MTNSGSNNVVIINTATNNVTGIIASGLHLPYGVAFSPSGTYAYVTEGENDTPYGELKPEVMEPVTVLDVVFIITILAEP